ncbi:xylulokinase [Cellulomonas aerilata]|uniref:Gluconokinase n=1 Tax=Cellulomonas aerilata TaxID=515326 RepID=A0A512D770_9CELL|nr:FGGY family carbohydrate kinase [Cellulomonas aerilata]GEO32322.1 gluconokinase [Cellulomonas aerilata]
MSTYVGIDLGTTATKAALIDSDGTVLARSRVAHSDARKVGVGRADPVAWIASVTGACRALGPAAGQAVAVGLAVHCPTALLFDADGVPLAAGLTWDHPENVRHAARVREHLTDDERRRTGNHLSPATMMVGAHSFFAEHEPDALAEAHRLGLVGTWLGQWFTGQSGLDCTQASYTGAFDVSSSTGDWMDGVLDRLGVPRELLPPIRPALSVLGALRPFVAESLGLAADIPVVVGSADTPAASFCLGARPGGTPLFIMGTTHVVSNCIGAPDTRAQALQRADVRPGQWLINGVTNGGDALAIGAQLLGYGTSGGSVQSLIEDAWAATRRDVTDAPVFIPHVVAERGPLWLDQPRTALIGMVSGTGQRQAARGALEGVLFADRMIIESCVSPDQGPVLLSGAFGSDVAVPQLLADMLDKDIRVVDEGHLPSIGAASMAVETLEGHEVPGPSSRLVHPRASWHDAVEDRWQHYQELWQLVVGRPPLAPLRTRPSLIPA